MKKKQILLTAIGTRGDAQPLVVIAQRLMKDGHTVRVAVHPAHKESVEKQGVRHYPLEGFDPEELMTEQMGSADQHSVAYEVCFIKPMMYNGWYKKVFASTLKAATEPLEDGTPFKPDAVIASHQQFGALPIAEKFGAQLFFFNTYPMSPTRAFRHPFGLIFEGKDTPDQPLLNRFTFYAYDFMQQAGLGGATGDFRHSIGLPRHNGGWFNQTQELLMQWKIPCFCIWSPHLLPKPPDWHENLVVCGSVDRTGGLPDLPADLVSFCKAGEPPIFFGFGPGSMSNIAAIKRSWTAAVGAIEELGCRAVMHVTPMHREFVERIPPNTFLLDVPVPHAKLFELCSICTHHGGPGTLHAALRAGKPNCIVSFVCDNPFWGDRLQNMKLGSHVQSNIVTTPLLVAALKQLQVPDVWDACAAMQQQMATEENGTEILVRELYKRLPSEPVDYDALNRQLPYAWPTVVPLGPLMSPLFPLTPKMLVGFLLLLATLMYICLF